VGAVVTALLTPKSGPEMRGDIKDAAARARRKAEALAKDASGTLAELKERSLLAAADLKRGFSDSVTHLKQPVHASAAGTEAAEAPKNGWDVTGKG